MHADFEFYGSAVGLTSCCIYGGTPYRTQEMALKKGVDVVVGAPGRIKVKIISSDIYSIVYCLYFFFFKSLFCTL